jgi:tRNA(fMet)-specific endonuclease VapC
LTRRWRRSGQSIQSFGSNASLGRHFRLLSIYAGSCRDQVQPATADEIVVNAIVLGELAAGFIKGGRRRRNQEELNRFLSSPRVNVVDVTEETAERYGIILNSLWKAGTPIPTNDIWIAASAMEHGLQILTTDAHYNKVPQVMVEHFPS